MTPTRRWKPWLLGLTLAMGTIGFVCSFSQADNTSAFKKPYSLDIGSVFAQQQLNLSPAQVQQIRPDVELGIETNRQFPNGNSKLHFTAVQIADDLGLNPQIDQQVLTRIESALKQLAQQRPTWREPIIESLSWNQYFDQTLALNTDRSFLDLVERKGFSPVKISWEDIGRTENSVWGDRISDVGIWVRKDEQDPDSAQLALSVRRDNNFRDKILMVPAEQIKVHVQQWGRTVEYSLPTRLKQLGLASATRDKNVIVSNQFAIVPVPSVDMDTRKRVNHPPRTAFNFSIYPYGSTNFVITDVIEGSSNAIVGPGQHQLLYANANGKKAPFTASRAQDRQDLLRMERELKAQGMDVDVQRYYLIQIPLKQDVQTIRLSNMGTPPNPIYHYAPYNAMMEEAVAPSSAPLLGGGTMMAKQKTSAPLRQKAPGLDKVAIGHGDTEGRYFEGSGYRNQRADEPIRVTVVYFVTPKGKITQRDMDQFSQAFEQWDQQAIWGGSFVTPNAG